MYAKLRIVCVALLFIRELVLFFNTAKETVRAAPKTPRAVLLSLRKILTNGYILTTLISTVVLIILLIIIRIPAENMVSCYIPIFIFCARSIDFDRVVKVFAVVIGALLVFIVGASVAGIIPNLYLTGGHTGYFLGFYYPLFPAAFSFGLVCAVLYIIRRSNKRFPYLALLAFSILIFALTGARLSFVASVIAIVLCFILSSTRFTTLSNIVAPFLPLAS